MVFRVAFVRVVIVGRAPLTLISDFRVWDVEVVIFCRELVGYPAVPLVVILDNIPEAMCEVKLNRDKRAFVVYEISLYFS